MHTHRIMKWAALATVLLLVFAACSGGDDRGEAFSEIGDNLTADVDRADDSFSGAGTDGAAADEAEAPSEAVAAQGELGSGGIQPVVQPSDIGRDIIFTADVVVAVTNVAEAGEEATNAMEALGGFLFGQQTTGGPNPESRLTFKVIPENFQEALTRLGSIGELRTQNVSADDVTERVVDLESRIATARASVERLREFLDGATDIDTIAQLEAQLLERETTLETLRGSLRTIQGQVDLATIFLTLTEAQSRPALSVSVTSYLGDDDAGASCPGSSGINVEEGQTVTLCYELFNTGDINLTDFTFRDPVLDMEIGDLILVFGDLETPMEPGQTIVLAALVTVDRNLRTASRITATPINADGEKVEGRDVSNTSTHFIEVRDAEGLPGFADGVSATWDFLQRVWGVLVLLAGLLLPVIPIAAVVFGIWRWRRARDETALTRGGTWPSPPVDDDEVDDEVDAEDGFEDE